MKARFAQVVLDDGSTIECVCRDELAIHDGDLCIVEVGSVLEFGRLSRPKEVECPADKQEKMPVVVRRATLQDQSRARENAVYLKMAKDMCRRKVEEHKLEMQVVNVRHSFDRKVITIAYTAEQRIQFRELVKELAAEFQARIEMKQIGIRDAAGIVGGMGPCGRQLCCGSWLRNFEAVSVRMAKDQKLSLNPNTISGVCGRLKCCLRFENACYRELSKVLPREGATVSTPEGKGRVIGRNILAQKVKVRLDDEKIREFRVVDGVVGDTTAEPVGQSEERKAT